MASNQTEYCRHPDVCVCMSILSYFCVCISGQVGGTYRRLGTNESVYFWILIMHVARGVASSRAKSI